MTNTPDTVATPSLEPSSPARDAFPEPMTFPHPPAGQDPANCPAAAIGRRLAGAIAFRDKVESVDQRAFASADRLITHLLDGVEWVTPSSIDGLIVVAMGLRDAVDDIAQLLPGDPGSTEEERRFVRLFQRLVEGLSTVAGHTPADIGLEYYWNGVGEMAPDLSDFDIPQKSAA